MKDRLQWLTSLAVGVSIGNADMEVCILSSTPETFRSNVQTSVVPIVCRPMKSGTTNGLQLRLDLHIVANLSQYLCHKVFDTVMSGVDKVFYVTLHGLIDIKSMAACISYVYDINRYILLTKGDSQACYVVPKPKN